MPYAEDTPQTLYDECEGIENEIANVGRGMKAKAKTEANAISAYEKAKCDYVIEMLNEEAKDTYDGPKRTDKIREAMYRSKFSELRLAVYLAKADLSSEKDLLKALDSKLSGIQTRKGLMMAEMNLGGGRP